MRHRSLLVALAAVAPSLSACDALQSLTGGDCTTIAIPGISVAVFDSLTHAGLFFGTTVRAYDGAYTDSLTVTGDPGSAPDALPISVAFEHAGTFRVTVTHPGYIAWTTTGVQVKKDGCHVQTARLTAQLVR